MGKYQLEYDGLNELSNELLVMNNELKSKIKQTAKEIANDLATKTSQAIPREAKAKHGVHLADDVKSSVSVSDKRASITVRGGSKTGGYWWIVDNGHIAKNGKFVNGAHFTDKAFQSVNVEGPVSELINEVLSNERS